MIVSISKCIIGGTWFEPKYWDGTSVNEFNGEIGQTNQNLQRGLYDSLLLLLLL
jgi:hypothetical protein